MNDNSNDTAARAFPIFAAAFAIAYVVIEQQNWALFTYHARTGELGWLRQAAKAPSNPAMHWFGWLASSAIVATLVTLAALPLTRKARPPAWIGWAIPLAVIVLFVYLFRSFFLPR